MGVNISNGSEQIYIMTQYANFMSGSNKKNIIAYQNWHRTLYDFYERSELDALTYAELQKHRGITSGGGHKACVPSRKKTYTLYKCFALWKSTASCCPFNFESLVTPMQKHNSRI